jgi:thermitase
MKWTLKINGEKVTWRLSDRVARIPPPGTPRPRPQREKPYGDKERSNGKHHSDREELALKTFKRAGWKFVNAKALRPRKNGGRPPATEDYRQVFTNKRGDVLIETDVATVQLNAAVTTKQRTAERVLAEDGLKIIHRLSFAPHLYTVQLPSGRSLPETIEALQAKTHRYVFAEPNMLERISGRQAPNDPLFGVQWQHDDNHGLHSLAAWDIANGEGVRIAIIDEGMKVNHDDLKDGIVGGGYFDYIPPGAGTATFIRFHPDMTDFPPSGHGTACMGMAGSRQNNGNGGSGIAPKSELLAIACTSDLTGTQETLARSIEYALNPQQVDPGGITRGADVISCSLDTFYHLTSVLRLAIESAANGRYGLGVPIFWAVNNRNVALSLDPVCSLPGVIAVGKSNEDGYVFRCARGEKLEFLAPGVNVIGPALWTDNDDWTGTSFATPLAAGVAALVLQKHPEWTAAQVLQRLRNTCDMPLHPANQNDRYGHGRINAYRAVYEPA